MAATVLFGRHLVGVANATSWRGLATNSLNYSESAGMIPVCMFNAEVSRAVLTKRLLRAASATSVVGASIGGASLSALFEFEVSVIARLFGPIAWSLAYGERLKRTDSSAREAISRDRPNMA
jgi:hypothetical protein